MIKLLFKRVLCEARHGPICCVSDNRVFVTDIWLSRRFECGLTAIAYGVENISEEAMPPDALNRRAAKLGSKLGIPQGGQLCKVGRGEIIAGRQFNFASLLREFIPRADGKAVITAVNAVAHFFTQAFLDGPSIFDR